MFIFAQLIGVFIMSAGLAIALKPQLALAMVAFWEQEQRLYWAGLIRLLFAGILILSAADAIWSTVVFIIGILFLISGVLIYALPETKLRAILAWFKALSPLFVRVWGGVACLLGLLILFAV
jgi:hypothetical protein